MPIQKFDKIDVAFLQFYLKARGPLNFDTLTRAAYRSQGTVLLFNQGMMERINAMMLNEKNFESPIFMGMTCGICENIPDNHILFLNQRDPRNPDENVLLEVTT